MREAGGFIGLPGGCAVKVLERLKALDERVLPPSALGQVPSRRWLLVAFAAPATFFWLANQAAWWLPYAAWCVAAAIVLVDIGDGLARADLAAQGLPLRPKTSSRVRAAVVGLAVFGGLMGGALLDNPRSVEAGEARRVVAAVLDAAPSGDGRGVCRYATDPRGCRRLVKAVPHRGGERPVVAFANPVSEGGLQVATVTLLVPGTPAQVCTLVVHQHSGELRVANPAYWTQGC